MSKPWDENILITCIFSLTCQYMSLHITQCTVTFMSTLFRAEGSQIHSDDRQLVSGPSTDNR